MTGSERIWLGSVIYPSERLRIQTLSVPANMVLHVSPLRVLIDLSLMSARRQVGVLVSPRGLLAAFPYLSEVVSWVVDRLLIWRHAGMLHPLPIGLVLIHIF